MLARREESARAYARCPLALSRARPLALFARVARARARSQVWGIPEDGLTETITEPLVDLHGHGRKVTLLRFNPTTNNVLASISADLTMKVWDIEKGAQISTATSEAEQLLQDVVWDYFGGQYAASSKDKCVRIYDARAGGAASAEIHEAHEGAKSTKLTFLGRLNNLVTVGFTKQSQRQFKIWDPRKLDKYTKKVDIDQAAGVIIPCVRRGALRERERRSKRETEHKHARARNALVCIVSLERENASRPYARSRALSPRSATLTTTRTCSTWRARATATSATSSA